MTAAVGVEAWGEEPENRSRGDGTERQNKAAQIGGCNGDRREYDWDSEPDICRVVDGVSPNVDRLGRIGNAVLPQIAEWIGHRILRCGNWRGGLAGAE